MVTSAKCAIVKAMEQISDMRANFRLASLLWDFRVLNQTPNQVALLDEFHQLNSTGRPLSAAIEQFYSDVFEKFNSKFTSEDGTALDLGKLAGGAGY